MHLFRDLEHTEKYKAPGKDWPDFVKKLRRLLGDAIRLWRRQEDYDEATYIQTGQLPPLPTPTANGK